MRAIARIILLIDREDIFSGFLIDFPAISSAQGLSKDDFGGLTDFESDAILFKVLFGRALSQIEHKVRSLGFLWVAIVTTMLREVGLRWDAMTIITGAMVLMGSDGWPPIRSLGRVGSVRSVGALWVTTIWLIVIRIFHHFIFLFLLFFLFFLFLFLHLISFLIGMWWVMPPRVLSWVLILLVISCPRISILLVSWVSLAILSTPWIRVGVTVRLLLIVLLFIFFFIFLLLGLFIHLMTMSSIIVVNMSRCLMVRWDQILFVKMLEWILWLLMPRLRLEMGRIMWQVLTMIHLRWHLVVA